MAGLLYWDDVRKGMDLTLAGEAFPRIFRVLHCRLSRGLVTACSWGRLTFGRPITHNPVTRRAISITPLRAYTNSNPQILQPEGSSSHSSKYSSLSVASSVI